MLLRIAIGLAGALIVAWLVLVAYLLVHRPAEGAAREAVRLLPDTVRLIRRIAGDRGLPRGLRARLWLLLAYLAFPIDLVPDFLPVVGYADDIVIVGVALRSVVRRAGPDAVRRHWPGTDVGLRALWSAAGLPGAPPARTS
ncbi:MAG TPA: DUF1232 domain-containing protein [Actinomycetota bacterium]|nr:DUF1232 domain-containing protein [Actinomycetota bacterium]